MTIIDTALDAQALFKKLPLLMEEFLDDTDTTVSYADDVMISPFLSREKMLGDKSAIADMVLSSVPLYCAASDQYSETRDPSVLSVPRSMQTEFWGSLFKDAFASELNSVLLDATNKLKYPFLGEEHILNRALLKKFLTVDVFSDKEKGFYLVDGEADDKIDSTSIDAIVDEKLRSVYALCDYSPSYSGFIDDWLSSLYLSGQISYADKIREENLYKIQDLKAELLRRKFAGSAALYHIILSAINRRGTYAPAVPLKSVENSSEFKDNRLIRALYLPGITIDTSRLRDTTEDPLSTFAEAVPPRTLIPLYYSSAGKLGYYDSNAFDGFVDGVATKDFLRVNSTTFAWDNLRGVTDASLFRDTYPRLDSSSFLDGYDSLGDVASTSITLDDSTPLYDLSFVSASFFDVQADQILYHRSSLQESVGHTYPYVTYTIADNNSLSMMDLPWLEYIEQVLDDKTRVQEEVNLGVQVSRLVVDPANAVRENFTVITFDTVISNSFSEQQATYDANCNYAFLWNVSIQYDSEDLSIVSVTPRLITYVLLQVDTTTLTDETVNDYARHPSWSLFTQYSMGLLPFAYGELSTANILSHLLVLNNEDGLIDDLYEEEYNKAYFLFTDNEKVAIAKQYLNTPAHTLIGSGNWSPRPQSDQALKHVIYGITRIDEATGEEVAVWSEPLRLFSKGSATEHFWSDPSAAEATAIQEFTPDWKGLVSYINPYLNFTEQSASPLRRRDVRLRVLRSSTDTNPVAEAAPSTWPQGPSPWCALMDLAVTRGYDKYISEDGLLTNENYPLATYLHRARQNSAKEYELFVAEDEILQVWGDNRPFDELGYSTDPADNWDAVSTRSEQYQDDMGVFALKFAAGSQYSTTVNQLTYYALQPAADDSLVDYTAWIWNDPADEDFVNGVTICVDAVMDDPADAQGIDATGQVEMEKLEVLSIPTVADTITVAGVAIVLDPLVQTTEQLVAEAIAAADYSPVGWSAAQGTVVGVDDHIVYFTATEPAVKATIVFDGTTSGVSATVTVTTVGYDVGVVDNFYLASYRGTTDKTINASFDWYFTPQHELVFTVYPKGNDTTDWTVTLSDIDFVVERQAQIAASYQHVFDEESGQLHIRQSIVADRKWIDVYRVVVYDDTAETYEVYETAADFNIEGLTPTETDVTMAAPYAGHFYGELIRNKDTTDNSLKEICVLNREKGYNSFLGTLYDFRLYRRGVALPELVLLCSGTRRELYSYSPSLYKLAYQHYSDPGVLRRPVPLGISELQPKRIRAFTRSVWDSIIVDLYPTSAEERLEGHTLYREDYRDPLDDQDIYDVAEGENDYKTGVLEQLLVNNYEAMSEVAFPSGTTIYYRGQAVDISGSQQLTFLQTVLYPIQYSNESFSSGLSLQKDEAASTDTLFSYKAYSTEFGFEPPLASTALLPSVPSGDTLQYTATLDVNFRLPLKVYAASPFDRGFNIAMRQCSERDTYVVTHASPTAQKKAANNFLLLPLYIPSQGDNDSSSLWNASLQGLQLQGVSLSEGVSALLSSSSYYNELQVPYPVEVDDELVYTSRWNALRTLREGSYFITCKYPVKVLPFGNNVTAGNQWYATVYATVRLKVVVQGVATSYEEALMEPRTDWLQDNLKKHLTSKLYSSSDNRTYPHRQINIDLYMMRSNVWDSDSWLWEKIASNYDELVQGISAEDVTNGDFIVEHALQAYFSKSYDAPLFNNDFTTDKVAYTVLGGRVPTATEKLRAVTESHLDTLTLLSGRTYKLLFDYSAQITELSYCPAVYADDVAGSHLIEQDELDSYEHSVSLLTSGDSEAELAKRRVFYTGEVNLAVLLPNDYDINHTRSGYEVASGGGWQPVSTDYGADTCALGNPYSAAASENLLLAKLPSARDQIESLAFFPYKQQDLSTAAVLPPACFSGKIMLPTVQMVGNTEQLIQPRDKIYEYDILLQWHRNLLSMVSSRLRGMVSRGAVASLAFIEPIAATTSSFVSEELITASNYDFLAYTPAARSIPLTGLFTIDRTSMWQNDVVVSNNFSDRTIFTLDPTGGSYVYDATKLRDVFTLASVATDTASITYRKTLPATSRIEIDVWVSQACTIQLFDGAGALADAEALLANSWTTVTVEVDRTTAINTTTMLFTATATPFVDAVIKIASFTARKRQTYSHVTGLSDVKIPGTQVQGSEMLLLQGSSENSNSSGSLITFKKLSTSQYFPLQVLNTTAAAAHNREMIKATFIANNTLSYEVGSDETPLLRPWKRQLTFAEKDDRLARLHKYMVVTEGGFRRQVVSATPINTVFSISNDYEDVELRSVVFNSSSNSIEFKGPTGLLFNVDEAAAVLKSNLVVATVDPIAVTNESFSLVANCVHPEKFEAGLSSPVVVTNFQVLNDDEANPAIMYELEYLPIIYDEARHHLSVNFLVQSN